MNKEESSKREGVLPAWTRGFVTVGERTPGERRKREGGGVE